MTIRSSKKTTETRLVSPDTRDEDREENTNILRPKRLDEYVGQSHLRQYLGVTIESARIRSAPIEHVLLYGPPGLGKTTLAHIIAREMDAHLRQTSGPALEKPADLVSVLTSLQTGDVLFIDEMHRLKPHLEEILYSAMEDRCIDIMIGSGAGATSIRMDLSPFTLVGATTKLSRLSNPLRDRFGHILKLDLYETKDLERIVERTFRLLGCDGVGADIHQLVASRSRGTPRITNRYAKILRDYATVGSDIRDARVVSDIFEKIGIDERGLDVLDRKFLAALSRHFGGRAVGLSTLAAHTGEEE